MAEIHIPPTEETSLPTPVDRITKRITGWLYRHTLKGRYDEYMTKYRDTVTDKVTGRERYDLRIQLEKDAASYSRNKVVRDLAIGTALVGSTVLLGKELATGRPNLNRAKFIELKGKAQDVVKHMKDTPNRIAQDIQNAPLAAVGKVSEVLIDAGVAASQAIKEDVISPLKNAMEPMEVQALQAQAAAAEAKAKALETVAKMLGSDKY